MITRLDFDHAPGVEGTLLLLVSCLHLEPDGARDLDALLREDLDWPRLAEEAKRLRVTPLLWRHLSEPTRSRLVPPETMATFETAYRVTSLKTLRMYGCLLQTLKYLHEQGLPVILLKGAYLAQWVYGDVGLRPMSDVDLLCRPGEAELVQERLKELGLVDARSGLSSGVDGFASPLHRSVLTEHLSSMHLPPVAHPGITSFEVHGSIIDGGPGRHALMEDLWRQRQELPWQNLTVSALHPTHQVFHLCVHLYKHAAAGAGSLLWFCDIHEVLRQQGEQVDWQALRRMVRETGQEEGVEGILGILRRYWGTPVPADWGEGRNLRLEDLLFDPDQAARSLGASLPCYLERLSFTGNIQGWRHRLAYMWGYFFPSRENLAYRYQPESEWAFRWWTLLHPFVVGGRVMRSAFFWAWYRLRRKHRSAKGAAR